MYSTLLLNQSLKKLYFAPKASFTVCMPACSKQSTLNVTKKYKKTIIMTQNMDSGRMSNCLAMTGEDTINPAIFARGWQ